MYNKQILWTVREIAEKERLSIDTVKRALRNKRLRGRKVGGRGDWRISEEDYRLWIDAGAPTRAEQPPTPEPSQQEQE